MNADSCLDALSSVLSSDGRMTRPRHPWRERYCRVPWLLILLTLLVVAATAARAQDIEPRAYSNAPIGVNFLGAGYAYTQGSLPTDASVPLTNSHLITSLTRNFLREVPQPSTARRTRTCSATGALAAHFPCR